jgi:hypothetical protein
MSYKIAKIISDTILIPASSFALFELGKNYSTIKNSIQNNNLVKNTYNNILKQKSFYK